MWRSKAREIWGRCGNPNRVQNDAIAGRGPGAKERREPLEAGNGKETSSAHNIQVILY